MSMRITLTPEEERAVADAYSRTWWLWLVAGILWLLLGFIVLSLRPASITVCVILIAIAFWLGGITQLALGFVLEGGWRWLAIIGGTLALLAGIAAIVLARTHARRDLGVRGVVPADPGIFDVGHRAVAHARARVVDAAHRRASSASHWARGRSATPTARCCCWCRSSASGRSSRESPISWPSFEYRRLGKELPT